MCVTIAPRWNVPCAAEDGERRCVIGGGPLRGVLDRAERLLEVASSAVRDGVIGYGVVIARR
jgi:hypothetical protein